MRPPLFLLLLFLIAGCATVASSPLRSDRVVRVENDTAYLVPFVSTLVPEAVSEEVFNDLVDALNDRKPIPGIQSYIILKDDPSTLNREWLDRQFIISGEIWSYRENSGCCSTELSIRARLTITDGLRKAPPRTVTIPVDRFFEHDYSTLERERERLSRDLSRAMYRAVVTELDRPTPDSPPRALP